MHSGRSHVVRGIMGPPDPCSRIVEKCNLTQIERAKSEPFELTDNGPDVFVKRFALKFSDSPIEFKLAHPHAVLGFAQCDPAIRVGRNLSLRSNVDGTLSWSSGTLLEVKTVSQTAKITRAHQCVTQETSQIPRPSLGPTAEHSKQLFHGYNAGILCVVEYRRSVNAQKMLFGLHSRAKRDHRKVLQSISVEGLEIVLQAFALIRQKIAEPYVDVLLKEAAHQIVLVSEALRFHTVRSKQQARRFDSAATNYVHSSFRRSLFPR
jgi:hypothetical protein